MIILIFRNIKKFKFIEIVCLIFSLNPKQITLIENSVRKFTEMQITNDLDSVKIMTFNNQQKIQL